jgi:shikimate dehydrogenase
MPLNAPDQYGVFGNPIAQSKSPYIHRAFAEQTGEHISYEAELVAPGEFAEAADRFFQAGGKGLNITAPFKGDAYAYATQLSPRARRAGAVNTLALQDDGGLLGDTTDGVGLAMDLGEHLNWDLGGKQILILGAGGAARGVLESLLALEPKSLSIGNRTASKAVSLAKGYGDLGNVVGVGLDQLDKYTEGFDLIISATSAGLSGEAVELPENLIKRGSQAYDMIYSPVATPFMQWAEALGAEPSDGLGMLVGQAAESFRLWRGVSVDILKVIASLRAEMLNGGN